MLSVVRVASYERGIDLANSGAFGNGIAIFTNDGGRPAGINLGFSHS